MFIDKARIHVRGGKGGNGAVAWRREKFEPAGGPFGGDGGDGGSVIIKADEGLSTLLDFKYKKVYQAEHGENGKSKRKFGKDGEDTIIKVPVGTLIKDDKTNTVIKDLKKNGDSYVIAKGGRGGRGNARFATSTRQAPNFAEPGTKGEDKAIILELKLIADIGLIGFPNVGKSTILSILSAANPKIANYHFTTLKPNLGVVEVDKGKSFVIADIPGLIEGASKGIGLGFEFLRHIERTKALVHVLDISGIEGRDPIEDFYKINEELSEYDIKLEEKVQVICANKSDLPGADDNLIRLKKELLPKGYKVFEVSAATKKGVKELKYGMWDLISKIDRNYETYDDEYIEEVYEEESIIVYKEGDKYFVDGEYIERLLEKTYFEDVDSLRYFQESIRRNGIVEKLEELGINEGDTVIICGYEFEFIY